MRNMLLRITIFIFALLLGMILGSTSIREYYRQNSFFEKEIVKACDTTLSRKTCTPFYQKLTEIERE